MMMNIFLCCSIFIAFENKCKVELDAFIDWYRTGRTKQKEYQKSEGIRHLKNRLKEGEKQNIALQSPFFFLIFQIPYSVLGRRVP